MSGASLFINSVDIDGIPGTSDLVKFVQPYVGCNIDFDNVCLMPGCIGVVLVGPTATPFGLIYEVLCNGEICIDVPAEIIDYSLVA